LQFACNLASPILLSEIVGWLGQSCYVWNDDNSTLSPLQCECSTAKFCIRDNVRDDGSSRLSDYPLWFSYGMWMALAIFGLNFIGAIAAGQEMYWSRSLGTKMRHVMQTATFRKILETSVQSRDKIGSGKIFTLITTDAEIMYMVGYMQARVLTSPFVLIMGFYLAIQYAGYAGPLVGLAVMFIFVPVLGILTKKQRKFQKGVVKQTATRTTHMNETVFGVKMIKMYAWVEPLMARLTGDRDEELFHLRGFSFFKNATIPLAFMMPSMTSIIVFVVYATVGPGDGTRPEITPDVAFTVISLFAVYGARFVWNWILWA
jgi:ABC-type multidrug transport system fused ATPase/permease subunit